MEGGALRVGLGCGEDGGVGPTLVAYLLGAGAGAVGTVEVTTVEVVAGMTGALWLAAMAVVSAAAAAAATMDAAEAAAGVGSGLGLDPPARRGEELHTRGLKLCPPRVFTMPGPEKGRRWRE